MIYALPSPQLIEIHGDDAVAFANAQFCNDVLELPIGDWQYNAWLNPQGRVHAFFALLRPQENTLLLILRGGRANEIAVDLARYKFRSKVSIRTMPDWHAQGMSGAHAVADHSSTDLFGDASGAKKLLQGDGWFAIAQPGSEPRLLSLTAAPPEQLAVGSDDLTHDADAWLLADICAGLPQLETATLDEFLPQALGLERLDTISFNKGCYPGQEVVARVHFKGGNKRQLHMVELAAQESPAAGTAIYAVTDDSQPAGVILQSACVSDTQILALAVLRQELADQALRVAGAGAISLAIGVPLRNT
ncbi:YgfZ/GcvT domain-containing protein [Pseudolysobacter antarcticus]|nr:folate-binding protein YgfZ [Pseudolysobacter antarcticus]